MLRKLFKIIGAIVGIYVVFLVLNFVDAGFLKQEITAYSVQCESASTPHLCENVKFALRPTTYKVDAEKQEVLYWTQGFEVQRLKNCAIRDRENWSCKFNDESAEFGFTNGKFWSVDLVESITADLGNKTEYVSRIRWINQSCRDSWIPYLLCLQVIGRIDG